MRRSVWTIVLISAAMLLSGTTASAQGQRGKAPDRPRQLWAIVVGVGSPSMPEARALASGGSVSQALTFFGWLGGTAGWDRSHLLLLTDLGGSDNPGTPQNPARNISPTRKNLDWAFEKWLDSRVFPGDLVVFYFAGPARSVEPGDNRPSREFYLLPTDVMTTNLAATGWSLDRVLDRHARQGKYQFVCLMGTTMQPLQAVGRERPRPSDTARLNREWLLRLTRWPGVTAWLAADHPTNLEPADPAVTFTAALISGLGDQDRKLNLAACLQDMQRDSKLKGGGFQVVGGVPPDLNLWAGQLARPVDPGPPEIVLQTGHAGRILDIASTADGQKLATASQDSTVRVWSPAKKDLLRILTGHTVGVTCLGLSGDGRWLISGGGQGEVLVHEISENYRRRMPDRQPHDPGLRIDALSVLPDGRHFVTIDRKGLAFLWDLGTPALAPQDWLEGAPCRMVAVGGGAKDGVVAALLLDGSVRMFDASGAPGNVAPPEDVRPSTIALSPDGKLLGLGCDDGRLVVRDLAKGRQAEGRPAGRSIQRLVFSSRNDLAISHEAGARLIQVKDGPNLGDAVDLFPDRAAERLVFSPDGRLLAACSRNLGQLKVWSVEDASHPRDLLTDPNARAFTLAFSGDGRSLIAGSVEGSLKVLPAVDLAGGPTWTVPANRGKVQQVAVSPGRNCILSINELKEARLWELAQRSCIRLVGQWRGGQFLGDDQLVLAGRVEQNQPVRLARFDRRSQAVDASYFAGSGGEYAIPKWASFEVVAVSPDGTRVAAASGESSGALVCVWETAAGKLTHWIPDPPLTHPPFSLSFSADGRYLATAGGAKEVELWDLGQVQGALKSPAVVFEDANAGFATCVQIRPGDRSQLVTGHSDGKLLLWSWGDGEARQKAPAQILAEGFFNRSVHAIAFTPEGRYLAAAGDGTMIWAAELGQRIRPIRDLGTPQQPHHFEQISSLAVWPDWSGPLRLVLSAAIAPGVTAVSLPPRPLLVSGSDDTTLRFWDLQGRSLLGTFCTASATGDGPRPPLRPGVEGAMDWVLFTPDGHYDASEQGRELVRYREGDEGKLMEQFDDSALYSFELTDLVRSGRRLSPARLEPPPPLVIDVPVQNDPSVAEARLTVMLGSEALRDVRIYHDGMPIGLDEARTPLPDRFEVPVRLVPGVNRFYAMASRDGSYDSRSDDVEVRYEGKMEPGRLHVIALGVGEYGRARLAFAGRDAERLSQVLFERGLAVGQGRGTRQLLTDDQVTAGKVTEAFSKVVREVRQRPQDTVVVFLAGHTGVFNQEQFCLLLKDYPFPPEAPLLVAARGANPPLAPGAKVRPEDLLPMTVLMSNLMRLRALNRLVIVDACQAGAILSDPQVEGIRKGMEIGSRKARTAYLMATRRGEPALEIEPLKHGLFTYVLLRGMRAISPGDEAEEIADLKLRPDADYSEDGTITTAELDRYVQEVMPPIARLYPDMVIRRGGKDPQELDQSLQLKAANASFPLVRLAREAGGQ